MIEFQIRHSMFYQYNLFSRHAIDFRQEADSLVGHDHNPCSHLADFNGNSALVVRRGLQYGMERNEQWYFQPVYEWKDVYTILAAEYAKLMFQHAHIGAAYIDKFC